MKKRFLHVIGLLAVLCLLAGCGGLAGNRSLTRYGDMQYTRPDITHMETALETIREAAQEEKLGEVIRQINDFYALYDGFYTNYSLADVRYCSDMTDIYWEKEYNYCSQLTTQADNALDSLYRILAASPLREELEGEDYFGEGYFDSYDEPGWEDAFLALMDRETALQEDYYDLSAQALGYEYGSPEFLQEYGRAMAQVLVELIRVRQEIATYWGYEDYVEFASDSYYYRDYTVEELWRYFSEIQRELAPLYRQVNETGTWWDSYTEATEQEAYSHMQEAAQVMGGSIWEAFRQMDRAGLYDIGYSDKKYNASFEVYFTSYSAPFIFMNPEGSNYDSLTFAHEFGHFCNDYVSGGSYAGVDVLEVFSQGMEYLSLCYGKDTEQLTRLKMADSLFTYVEQAAYATFEMEMYGLEGEELTVENLYALYSQTAEDYGFGSVGYDPREFVTNTHFYTNPMYTASYVVSNDAAMELYRMEQEEPGAGLARFQENLNTEEAYFLAFLETAGLESPFAEGRLSAVREIFEGVFQ